MEANDRSMGIVVVGAGSWGAQRAAAVVAARGTRLIGVVDADPTRAQGVAARHRATAFPDLERALEHPEVDAVIVATPHADHGEAVRRGLASGKHVLCEKPLAIDPNHARALAILADERRVRLSTGFNHRFYPPIRDALTLVSRWAIGRVESVRAEIGHRPDPSFFEGWHCEVGRSGGGTLIDNGPHACDLIRRFLGEVVAAQGYVRTLLPLPDGCDSEAFALFRNHDRGVGELRSSWALEAGYLSLQVRGSEGFLRVGTAPWSLSGVLGDGRRIERRYRVARATERLFRRYYGCERSLRDEVEAFASLDRPHPRRDATGWDGCRVIEMIQAVYESSQTGREVALRPLLVHLPSLARRRALERQSA